MHNNRTVRRGVRAAREHEQEAGRRASVARGARSAPAVVEPRSPPAGLSRCPGGRGRTTRTPPRSPR
eukprot:56715-Rhodomonas_salina.1